MLKQVEISEEEILIEIERFDFSIGKDIPLHAKLRPEKKRTG